MPLDLSEVEFRDCEVAGVFGRVHCTVSMGEPFFHSRIAGHALWTTFSAVVHEDRIINASWPDPPGLVAADAEFEAWVIAVHPERYDEMFASPSSAPENIRLSAESAAARMELLEEFLASR